MSMGLLPPTLMPRSRATSRAATAFMLTRARHALLPSGRGRELWRDRPPVDAHTTGETRHTSRRAGEGREVWRAPKREGPTAAASNDARGPPRRTVPGDRDYALPPAGSAGGTHAACRFSRKAAVP